MALKFTLLILVALFAACVCENKYSYNTDNIDIKSILDNDRLLNNYINCLLDKGRCTKEGAELKKRVPDAIQTQCSKCSDKHKSQITEVTQFLMTKKPDMWKKLLDKYDPDRVYSKRFQELKKKQNVH